MTSSDDILTLNTDLGRLRSFMEIHLPTEQILQVTVLMDSMNKRLLDIYSEFVHLTRSLNEAQEQNKVYGEELYGAVITAQSGKKERETEDITPIDKSFFCTDRFTEDICDKNLLQAIHTAKSKADACRRITALETYGYLKLSNVKDARKAELINQFAAPKFVFTGDDFRKARTS